MSRRSRRPKRPLVETGDILPPTVAVQQALTVPVGQRAYASARIVHRADPLPAQKRPRAAETPSQTTEDGTATTTPLQAGSPEVPTDPGGKRTVKNGISKVLEEWRPRLSSIQEDILAAEIPEGIGAPCACGDVNPTLRCRDCLQSPLECHQCIVMAHGRLPFHWVDEWNGRFLERRDLSDVGQVLYLGHNGARCPFLDTPSTPINYTVTHTNGIHRIPIHECRCPGQRDTVSQLLRAGLFPATLKRPESAFTFDVLRQWDLHFLASKKGAYDYFEALRRLTDNSGTRPVKNRYREFNIAARLWQHLSAEKRAGIHHGLILPNRRPTITVPCFACPWPGFNMPSNWKETPPHLSYIHGCELGGDGNHGLQKKRKRDDPDDFSLSEGKGYFVDPAKMKSYLEGIESETPPETCSGFKVGRAQRPGKFRHLEVSGVVAVICIRHGCFRPGAMVDLQKGERYGHMDFALAGALEGMDELLHFIFTYDVACIYGINLRKRFEERFPHLLPLLDRLLLLLPKMHALAHREVCQIVYALCYAWGAGLTHGETVEHPWAEHNQVGLSTREMSIGHRHDALNAIHNYWNWCKMESAGAFLARKLREAFALHEHKSSLFDALTRLAGSNVAEWEKLEASLLPTSPQQAVQAAKRRAASKKRARKVKEPLQSVYMLDESKVPGAGKAYEELVNMEIKPKGNYAAAAADKVPHGTTAYFRKALELERQQYELRVKLKRQSVKLDDDDDEGDAAVIGTRRTLCRELEKLRELQTSLLSRLRTASGDGPSSDSESDAGSSADDEEIDDVEDAAAPEEEPLGLPSDFSPPERATLGLEAVAVFERRIRNGCAYDLLAAVKESINHQGAFLTEKQRHARGQKDNTRSQTLVSNAAVRTRVLAGLYNYNRDRLVRLSDGIATDILRPINIDTDLKSKNWRKPREQGDSREEQAWIWTVVPPWATSGEVDAWQLEVDRVQWFRARADLARVNEEINKLHAEFKRVVLGFSNMSRAWQAAAANSDLSASAQAYGLKKAAMFSTLSQQCASAFAATRRDHVEKWDYSQALTVTTDGSANRQREGSQ